jgi:hypothetical protein
MKLGLVAILLAFCMTARAQIAQVKAEVKQADALKADTAKLKVAAQMLVVKCYRKDPLIIVHRAHISRVLLAERRTEKTAR